MNKLLMLLISIALFTVSFGCEPSNNGCGEEVVVDPGVEYYKMRGPYTVKKLLNVGKGTIPNGAAAQYPDDIENDPTALTLYFPENSKPGDRFPLLTFGNGTSVIPSYYDELIEHVVSHGFVVIGANHSQSGSGQSMLKAVEWAVAQANDADSPIYGIVDTDMVGAFGQSQGGSGTCNAGLDPRIDTIVPLSGIPLSKAGADNFTANLKIPAFFVNSAQEDGSNQSVQNIYKAVKVPAVYGATAEGTNHNSYGDIEDNPGCGGEPNDAEHSRGGITAWFEWHLKGKQENRSLFVGTECGYCSSPDWKTIESKGF